MPAKQIAFTPEVGFDLRMRKGILEIRPTYSVRFTHNKYL